MKEPWEVKIVESWDTPRMWATITIRKCGASSPNDEIWRNSVHTKQDYALYRQYAERIVIEHNAMAGLTNEEVKRYGPEMKAMYKLLYFIQDIGTKIVTTRTSLNLLGLISDIDWYARQIINNSKNRIEGKE